MISGEEGNWARPLGSDACPVRPPRRDAPDRVCRHARIQHATAARDAFNVIASIGSASGQIRLSEGIANLPNGPGVLSAGGHNRAEACTTVDYVLGVRGRSVAGADETAVPRGVVISRAGILHVAVSRNHRIHGITPDGHFLGSSGGRGTGSGEFDPHQSVSLWALAEPRQWRVPETT